MVFEDADHDHGVLSDRLVVELEIVHESVNGARRSIAGEYHCVRVVGIERFLDDLASFFAEFRGLQSANVVFTVGIRIATRDSSEVR